MGPFVRRLLSLLTILSAFFLLALLAACGGSSHSSTSTSGGTSTGTSGSGTSGANTGSTNSGTSGGSSTSSGSGSATGTSGSGGTAGSGGSSNSFVAYAYTASASNLAVYGVNADGSLVAAPGSPYAADSNNKIVTNGANVYILGSDQMTLKVFAIDKSDGSLTLANSTNAITGNTFAGDIADSLSLDHTGSGLYIGEVDSSGDDGVNYWRVGSDPTVTQVQWDGDSEVFGPPLVWSPDNKYAYSGNCYHTGWTLFDYTRNSDGTLSQPNFLAAGPPVASQSGMPCPAAFAVSSGGYLAIAYTATPQGGPFSLATYKINADGTLTLASNSPVATASNGGSTGQEQIAINFDPTGTYLAVAGNGGVQTYTMSSSGALTASASPQSTGVAFQGVAWDKSNHLFATSSNQLYVWNASNGMLTSASGSPYGSGGGLAVLPLQ